MSSGCKAAVRQSYYCGHDPSPAVLLSVQANVTRRSPHMHLRAGTPTDIFVSAIILLVSSNKLTGL